MRVSTEWEFYSQWTYEKQKYWLKKKKGSETCKVATYLVKSAMQFYLEGRGKSKCWGNWWITSISSVTHCFQDCN